MSRFTNILPLGLMLASMLMTACIPAAKKTDCPSGQAYSATIRACAPVTPNEDSFVTVSNPTPAAPIVRRASDSYPLTLSVGISNPYSRPYKIKWVREINGVSTTISSADASSANSSDHTLSRVMVPSVDFGAQVGTHVVTVSVLDTSNNVIDSHGFTIQLGTNPVPYGSGFNPSLVTTTSMSPAIVSSASSQKTFTLTVNRNGATITSPEVRWTVTKVSGTPFAAYAPAATPLTLSSSYSTATTSFVFDSNDPLSTVSNPTFPADAADYVGTYQISAAIYDSGLYVDAYTWDVVLANPTLGQVTTTTLPSTATSVTAYNGVAYNTGLLNGWSYSSGSSLANFCVTVSDPDGQYNVSGTTVYWYMQGNSTAIASQTTSSGTATVCIPTGAYTFTDALYTNTTYTSSIYARVIDNDTNQEYSTYSGGSYPPTWNVAVKPQNKAPTVDFSTTVTGADITCSAAVGTSKTCAVKQDSAFTLGVTVSDDFYDPAVDLGNFEYTMTLKKDGAAISTCTKTAAQNTPSVTPDTVGPEYLCPFTVPSNDAAGPVNQALHTYTIDVVVNDTGSTLTTTDGVATTYTYNLTPVTEANTAPAITAQSTNPAGSYAYPSSSPMTVLDLAAVAPATTITEGDTLNFSILVTDAELDNHRVNMYRCYDSGCASISLVLSTNLVTQTDATTPKRSIISYTIPEDFVTLGTSTATSVQSYFLVEVVDAPSAVSTTALSDTKIFSTNVVNKNPAPTVTISGEAPVHTSAYNVAVGYPFTIYPGAIADTSGVATEKTYSYQWYVSQDDTTYSAIPGATSQILIWTPSLSYPGADAYLKMCVSDGDTTNYPLTSNFAAGGCLTRSSSSFHVNILKNEIASVQNASTADVQSSLPSTVWYDLIETNVSYAAWVDLSGGTYFINVDKFVRNTSGTLQTDFGTIRFSIFAAGTAAAAPTKISISGDADNLFIAYDCAYASASSTKYACIRRIEKGYVATTNEKSAMSHKGKFGFSYTGLSIAGTSNDTTNGTDGSGNYTITFNTVPTAGETIILNSVTLTASAALSTPATGDLCSTSTTSCSTTTGTASSLALAINSSTNTGLQGITATASGAVVTIYGMKANDYYESTSTITVGDLGSVVVSGTRWHLPYADAISKVIEVISSSTSSLLSTAVIASESLTTLTHASAIANGLDASGGLVIASVSAQASTIGRGYLQRLTNSGTEFDTVATGSTLMFGTAAIDKLRLSPQIASNNYHFVAAMNTTTNKWVLGRFDSTLTLINTTEQDLADLAAGSISGGSVDVAEDTYTQDVQIVTDPIYNGEARVAVTKFGSSSVDDGFYLLRFNSIDELSCAEDSTGACLQLNTFTTDVNSRISLSSGQSAVTIGNAGNDVSDNSSSIVHAVSFDQDAAGDRVFYSYFNIFPENIIGDHTSSTAGTSGWRPPFIR